MPKTYCPECDAVILMDHPQDGARIQCPGCNVDLEVVSINPFDVYFPHDEGWDEDWDDDDYEQDPR